MRPKISAFKTPSNPDGKRWSDHHPQLPCKTFRIWKELIGELFLHDQVSGLWGMRVFRKFTKNGGAKVEGYVCKNLVVMRWKLHVKKAPFADSNIGVFIEIFMKLFNHARLDFNRYNGFAVTGQYRRNNAASCSNIVYGISWPERTVAYEFFNKTRITEKILGVVGKSLHDS